MNLDLPPTSTVLWCVRLLLTTCVALVMSDAALDKFRDWPGNARFVRQVFAKSRLLPVAVPLLVVLAALMTGGALCSIGGLVQLAVGASPGLAWLGAVLSVLAFLGLLFGLQIGKNHEAAKGVVVYFAISVLAVWSFSSG